MKSQNRVVAIFLAVALIIGGLAWFFRPGAKTVTLGSGAATSKPLPFLNAPAEFVTPLGQGFLFFNKSTRGVSYGTSAGTKDISGSFLLTTDPKPSEVAGGDPITDTVVDIEPVMGGGAVVTTTRGVFVDSSAGTVTKLPDVIGQQLNFSSSAYDAGTNSLFALPAYSKAVYRYDLASPGSAPTVAYTAVKDINRLTASGGKFAVYFDDVPSADAGVLAEYGKTRQLDPLVIDGATGKLYRTLSEFTPVTNTSFSGSGKFIAIKRKYETTITLHNLENGQDSRLPSYDTAGAGWQAETYYLARDHAVWSYNAAARPDTLTKVADVTDPVTALRLTATDAILTTNTGQSLILGDLSQAQAPLVVGPQSGTAGPFTYMAVPPGQD